VKLAAGSDHAGLAVKQSVARRLRALGHEVVDVGTGSTDPADYPLYAHEVAGLVASGAVERGLLACGTGVGMCITANRHSGVRAAVCLTPEAAGMARRHNDANVLCLAGRVLSEDEAWAVTETWMATPFEGGRHARRVALIDHEAVG
jgi:ribose 5-phosphate isomerase B